MVLRLCLLSISNIGLGFALAMALSWRYRQIAARQLWASLTVGMPAAAVTAPRATNAATAVQPPAAVRVPTGPPPPKSQGHVAIDELQEQVSGFGAKLIATDERLRECAASPDLGVIETVLSDVENTVRNFAESRDAVRQRASDVTHNDAGWEGIHNELNVASQMQDVEIKAACQEIAKFDYENDLAGGCRKIVDRTQRLLKSNDLLRDALQKAVGEVLQQECRPPEETDRSDPLTGCINRAAIEHDLRVWWASVTDHSRLCVAMIDIDRLAEVNQQFGHRVGNEILKSVARLLEANQSDNVRVARFTGQWFLLMCTDLEMQAVANTIERCRQTIDGAHFEHKGADIRITVSCALTKAANEDSPSSMLRRVESVLREAKRYGNNRTFMHDGKYTSPVVPPDLTIEPLHTQV